MDGYAVIGTIVAAFIGGATGATLTLRGTKRMRLEDAYADLAGATTLLLGIAPGIFSEDGVAGSNEAWVRFGTTRARVLLQEDDSECRAAVDDLSSKLKSLHSVLVPLNRPENDEDRHANLKRHWANEKAVQDGLEKVLDLARRSRPD